MADVSTAFVKQFADNIQLVAQQHGVLRPTIGVVQTITGEAGFIDKLGTVEAVEVTTRNADSPHMDIDYSRYRVVPKDIEVGHLFDNFDRLKMLADPTAPITQELGLAMARKVDRLIIAAFNGTAYTGKDGSTAEALPSGQVIAAGGTGLTITKLRQARTKLLQNFMAEKGPFYCVITAKQLEDLLTATEVTSADYNTVRALVNGEVDTFLGFKFLVTELLPLSGTTRSVFAYASKAMALGVGQEIRSAITRRADKRFNWYAYFSASIDAVRIEPYGVVQIDCVES